MHRLALSLFIVLLARTACAADDARLDKPVTLAVKGEALADIMPLIEKQAGVRLKVAHDIADQKATIFVDDKPLKDVMAGLQTVFRYTWSYSDFKGKRSYSLSVPVKLRRERENWHKKAVDKAWPEFEAEIKRLAEMPVKTTEDLDGMLKQIEPTEAGIRLTADIGEFGLDRRKRMAARLYQTFSPSLRKMLREGMTICYDLDSPEPEWKMPVGVQAEVHQNLVVYYGVTVGSIGSKPEHRREFDTLSIELKPSVTPEKFSVEADERLGKCASYTEGYDYPLYEKLLARIEPTMKESLPRKDDPVLDSKVSFTAKELEDEAAVPKPQLWWLRGTDVNRSDLLALLHKKLGLQIISDHYSHWYSWSPADKLPLRSFLKSFERFPGISPDEAPMANRPGLDERDVIRLMEDYPAANWGWDSKFLYMRAADPAKMDLREIPNSILRRWQAASVAGTFGLTEIAEVNTLTEDQLDMLRRNLRRFGIEKHEQDSDIGEPALRLYGLLSPGQRGLTSDGRLGTSAFNSDQRAALRMLMPGAIAHTGCRVGVYDAAGLRVDKPNQAQYPEFLGLAPKDKIEYYFIGDKPVAKTLEETMPLVKTDSDRAQLRKVVGTNYEMTLRMADGSENTRKFMIIVYSRVQVPPKP